MVDVDPRPLVGPEPHPGSDPVPDPESGPSEEPSPPPAVVCIPALYGGPPGSSWPRGAREVDEGSSALGANVRIGAIDRARRVNLLVLDEPTNHLDLPAIDQREL